MDPGLQVKGLTVVGGNDIKCGCCGACCRTYSKVDVSISDIFQIAEFLGIGAGEFFSRYCKTMSDGQDSAVFLLDIEGGCRFQKDDRCAIYPVRSDMCAMYPFNLMCLNTSQALKDELKLTPTCAVHKLPDSLLFVPDLERMVDSRILFMVKEMYLARFGSVFREEEAREYHLKGLEQLENERLRKIIHMQLLNEFLKGPPRDPETNEPLLSAEDIKMIYHHARGREK